VLPGCNHGDVNSKLPPHTLATINNIVKEGDWCYAYHHDFDTLFLQNYPEITSLKKYPVLHDKDIRIISNTNNDGYFLSRTRKYMIKLQLMTLEQAAVYDCTVRCPTTITTNKSNTVIVYQGSKESLRKLTAKTINEFVKLLPDAVYLVTQETAQLLKLKEKNIKYLLTSPFTEDSLQNIVRLFETGPKAIIGPDSGLTQLACGYKIPLIWLQSRIPIQNVIDEQYSYNYKVYLKKNLTCKKECIGCLSVDAKFMQHGLFEIKEEFRVGHKNMECFLKQTAICLDYSKEEIEEIINLLKYYE
jgi:hypothetical protein